MPFNLINECGNPILNGSEFGSGFVLDFTWNPP